MKLSEFQTLAKQGNVIPVYQTHIADLLTPVSAFLKIKHVSPNAFLLESVEGGEKTARFSFLGFDPFCEIRYADGIIRERDMDGEREFAGNIFHYLHDKFRHYNCVHPEHLPRFTGGAVGYFGYETIQLIEDIPVLAKSDQHFPDAHFMLFDTVLAFDHLTHQIYIIKNVRLTDESGSLPELYQKARERIAAVRELLQADLPQPGERSAQPGEVICNFTERDFCDAVTRAKEYIRAGDIFQVVLSQQFARAISADPFDIYRALRIINPSPYLYFLQMEGRTIIGSSPELLVRVENRQVEVRPIAGTRKRGKTPAEDQELVRDLQGDAKERAEHVMLVDLSRNDVGQVSEFGSVRVADFMAVEKYSHVMHLVSSVVGKLRPELTALDALQACFPAGTVSGAPKIRAMEIISTLEPQKRGVYAGALGYLDFSGNLDTCISIRTIVTEGRKAFFQAGAGIVADSVPRKEYHETLHKSEALRAAIELAERGL